MHIVIRFLLLGFLLFLIFLFATSCSSDGQKPVEERSVESLYNEGYQKIQAENYADAAKMFDEVERQHPYSSWAAKAQLMAAYAYYENEKYDDAIMALDRFIQLHPGNKDAAYAYYLRAQCYYLQISDVYRDQKMTLLAKDALAEVFRRFPASPYARDARIKYDLTVDHLAGKEMAVGRYYLNREMYLAALNRFQVVIMQYQTTTHVEEALYRLVETYTALGLKKEAMRAAAVLGHNYPASEWYDMAYKIAELDAEKLAELKKQEAENSWFGWEIF